MRSSCWKPDMFGEAPPEDEAGSNVMTSKMPPQLRRSLVLATTRILVGSRVRQASAWEWMCLVGKRSPY